GREEFLFVHDVIAVEHRPRLSRQKARVRGHRRSWRVQPTVDARWLCASKWPVVRRKNVTPRSASRVVPCRPDRYTCGYTGGKIGLDSRRHANSGQISMRRDGRVVDGGGLENRVPV